MNLDGNPDFAVGAQSYDTDPDGTPGSGDELANGGRVSVYSGSDYSTLYVVEGTDKAHAFFGGGQLGAGLAGGGDVNLDGTPDILANANLALNVPAGSAFAGSVKALSGPDGTLLHSFYGNASFSFFGFGMGLADVDADGYADILTGEMGYDSDPDGTPGSLDEVTNAGRAYAFSGKDGSTLWTRTGTIGGESLGSGADATGDHNADGFPDVVIGSSWTVDPDGTPGNGDEVDAGRAYVFSGSDGSTLWTYEGTPGEEFPLPVVRDAGDVNADGISDIVIGKSTFAPDKLGPDGTALTGDEGLGTGHVSVLSVDPLSLTADTHVLSLSVANSQTMTIDAGVANAFKNYWLFTGFAASGDTPGVVMAPGVVIPLNQPDPLTSFVIGLTQLGGGAPTFAGWKSTLDLGGNASPSLNTFGPTPAPLGITLHHAALVYTADGCGVGCDTFQLGTNWVPMTTTP